MAWNYAYTAGPKGGSLTALSNFCTAIRLLSEGGSGKRGGNVAVQYLHGEHAVQHKFANPRLLPLEVVLRYTSSAGTITHADGAEGHVFENLSEVKRLLRGQRSQATLARTAPDMGAVQIDVECGEPTPTQNRFTYLFPLVAARPFWRSTTLNSTGTSPLAVGGDEAVDDAEIVFAGGGSNPVFTHTASGATVGIIGTVPAGGVRVFTETGQVIRVTGGTDYSEFLAAPAKAYILELDPGVSNAFTGTATVEWRDKWN